MNNFAHEMSPADSIQKKRKVTTLCFIYKHPRLLLGMKKRGFGAGRWNGFGGKVNEGESVEDAAIREMREEAGLEADDLEKHGVVYFEFEDEQVVIEVNIFKVGSYSGELIETEEMKPQWFMVDEIPFKEMWTDDLYWMPLFLQGKKFKGRFLLDKPSTADYASRIISKDLSIVKDF